MKKMLLNFVLLMLLSGCVSTAYLGTEAANKGNYAEAERLLTKAISEGETRAWNNLGLVYERTGRKELSIRAYTMAARYGNPTAQRNLTMMGLPVPAADLAASAGNKESSSEGWAAALKGFNDGRNGSATRTENSRPIICDSKRGSSGSVSTTCF